MSESSVTTEIVVRLPKQMVTELDGIGKQENKNRHELICRATQLLLRQHKTKKRYQHESMRRGYIEMGKINLGIASEAFLAEYEAAHTVERLVSGGNILIVKRGDVYFADLSPVVGSEQGGVRPVLVIQNDIGNRFSPTVIVAAITAQIQKRNYPLMWKLMRKSTVLREILLFYLSRFEQSISSA